MLYSKTAKEYLDGVINDSRAFITNELTNIRKTLKEGGVQTDLMNYKLATEESVANGIEAIAEIINKYGIKGMSVNNFKKIKSEIGEKFFKMRDHTFTNQYVSSSYFLQYTVNAYINNRYTTHVLPFDPFVRSPLYGRPQTIAKESNLISAIIDPTERNLRYIKKADTYLRKHHRNLSLKAFYVPLPKGPNRITLMGFLTETSMNGGMFIPNLIFDPKEYEQYMGNIATITGQAIAHSLANGQTTNINTYYGSFSYNHLPSIKKLLEKTLTDQYQQTLTTIQKTKNGITTEERKKADEVLAMQNSLVTTMLTLSAITIGTSYCDAMLQIMKNTKTFQKTKEIAAMEAVGRTNNYLMSIIRDGFDLGIVCQLVNNDCLSSNTFNGVYNASIFKTQALRETKVTEIYGITEIANTAPLDKIFKHMFGASFMESFYPTEEVTKIINQTGFNKIANSLPFEKWIASAPLHKHNFKKSIETPIKIVSSIIRMGNETALNKMGR